MTDPVEINGPAFEAGVTVFTVSGERGRFLFRGLNIDGSVHAWGGLPFRECARDFRPERITKIDPSKNNNRKQNHQ